MIQDNTINKICSGKGALVVGGSNGVGLAITMLLSQFCKVYIADKVPPSIMIPKNVHYIALDLTENDYSALDMVQDIDKLIITAGFGKLALFEDYPETLIRTMMNVNTIGVMRIIHRYYPKIHAKEDFYTGIMVSIAGFMSSPFFAVYGASKAALKIFIESLNVELLKSGTTNQILNVSPGSLKGTSFNGETTNLDSISSFAESFLEHMMKKEDLFIPQYEEIFKQVLDRYHQDFRQEGAHSYDYKLNSGRYKKT